MNPYILEVNAIVARATGSRETLFVGPKLRIRTFLRELLSLLSYRSWNVLFREGIRFVWTFTVVFRFFGSFVKLACMLGSRSGCGENESECEEVIGTNGAEVLSGGPVAIQQQTCLMSRRHPRGDGHDSASLRRSAVR